MVQYLGGKHYLAKPIVQAMRQATNEMVPVWEPFCGGGSVTVQLAKVFSEVEASDIHLPLVAMWRALQLGWDPPQSVTEAEFDAAAQLPDTDPRKAFIGFGCTFGGIWFAKRFPENHKTSVRYTRNAVLRQARQLSRVTFNHYSFFERPPRSEHLVIYCDPPYANTTTYRGTPGFDHMAFWLRCQEWVQCGVRVFVSEFACPIPHRVVWEKPRRICVRGTSDKVRIDTLYEVLKRP